jgi:hypothetical protein
MVGGADIVYFLMKRLHILIFKMDSKLQSLVLVNLTTGLEGPWRRSLGQLLEDSVTSQVGSNGRPDEQRDESNLHDERADAESPNSEK